MVKFLSHSKKAFAFVVLFSALLAGGHARADLGEEHYKSLMSYYQSKGITPPSEQPDEEERVFEEIKEAPLVDFNVIEPPAIASVDRDYLVGPDDVLRITVFGEDNLSDLYAVSGGGDISMPLIGSIDVAGLTLKDIENKITFALRDGYLVNPSVAIEVSQYRPFYILGEVRNPGSYSYVSNMSVLNAVALAGGFTAAADKTRAEILRSHKEQTDVLKDEPVDVSVIPGDIIVIKEKGF